MESFVVVVHVVVAVAIIGLVLIQQGKGADMGASFGSGASQTIFGSAGSGNALTRSTTWLALVFFVTSLSLAIFSRNRSEAGIEVESLLSDPSAATLEAPAPPNALPDLSGEAVVDPTVESAAAAGAEVVDAQQTVAPSEPVAADATESAETVEPESQTTQN